jgi:hypothetical protein
MGLSSGETASEGSPFGTRPDLMGSRSSLPPLVVRLIEQPPGREPTVSAPRSIHRLNRSAVLASGRYATCLGCAARLLSRL